MLHRASVHKPDVAPSALSRIGRRSGSWPVIVFALLSLAFGSAIVLANPPLRGPDEISHFLRIYSYTRGELLPAAEINGRKGVYVERALYDRLYFFKNSGELFATVLQDRKGEWFARAKDEGIRYGQIMAEYRDITGASGDEVAQTPAFAPFAGTEGYSPVAYAPYIIAAAVGRLLGLDLPELLFLMRFVGLVAFTAMVAYAIAVTPALKWAFVLIAMLPVSLYNRVVLSADGAALSYALVITALCFRAAWNPSAGRVWERSLWMTLCVLAKQPQIVFVLLELMAGRLRELPRRWSSLAIVVLPGVILSPLWVVGVSADVAAWRVRDGHNYPRRAVRSAVEALLHVGASISFPAGGMDGSARVGGPAVAGAHWHPGVAGHSASALDLSRAHDPPPARAAAKGTAGRSNACARGGHDRPCCPQLYCHGLSDLFPHLHASRFAPCLGRSRTLLRHRLAYGCDLHGLVDQPRITARHARADRDYWLNDCGNHDPGRGAASTLVMCQGPDMCSTGPLGPLRVLVVRRSYWMPQIGLERSATA